MRKPKSLAATLIIVILAIAVCVEAFAYFDRSGDATSDPLKPLWAGDFEKERAYWKDEVSKLGAAKAYDLFKKDTQGKQFGVAHSLSHILGELIYEKEGISGVAICDSSFAFGCYHSFFGKAISENGIGIVSELDKKCVEAWGPIGLGCPHGIGHGLIGYLGDDRMDQALAICDKLSWKGPIGGCTSGVFMEYNFHTMQSIAGIQSRPFDPAKPLYPCDAVDQKFAQSCYFELAAWILQSHRDQDAASGEICALAPKGPGRDACFKGLGHSFGAGSGYDIEKSIKSCSAMPNREDEVLCRAGASWAFFAEPTMRSKQDLLCAGLTPTEEKACKEEAKVISLVAPTK